MARADTPKAKPTSNVTIGFNSAIICVRNSASLRTILTPAIGAVLPSGVVVELVAYISCRTRFLIKPF